MFTKNFKELSKNDALIAGGKGASLGEMTNVGISVPPGFVVLSGAFEKFLEMTDLNVEIESILTTVDAQKMHTVEKASEKIQGLILEAKMPEDIKREIQENFEKLGAEYVAVRSSATAEDGAEHAWAGQLNSYLNTTEESLLENIQKCWASLFTPRAIFYRFELLDKMSSREQMRTETRNSTDKPEILVAVVVQKMIQSEKSGIAFSVHPVTEDYSQLIIEAGFGLGEAIVSGSITPDSYVVDKSRIKNEELSAQGGPASGWKNDEAIIDVNVNTQAKGLYRACHLDQSPSLDDMGRSGEISSNNEWRDILEPQASSQVLNKKEILELSDLIIKIENHYGFPCDIEWAYEKNKFYITQSRPITTLMKKKIDLKEDYIKFFNRGMCLISCQAYDKGERVELLETSGGRFFMDPVFVKVPHKGTDMYFNFTDPSQNPEPLIKFFNDNPDELLRLKEKFDKNFLKARDILKNQQNFHINGLFQLIVKLLPLFALGNMFGDERENIQGIKSELIDIYRKIRKQSDGLMQSFDAKTMQLLEKIVPHEYAEYLEYLTLEEVVAKQYPPLEMLKKRQVGYIFHKGNLHVGVALEEYATNNNYEFVPFKSEKEVFNDVIEGSVAHNGTARGFVKILFEDADVAKIKKGDILVASMTTPNFIVAMKKASAFVTDEGGITCHAAIIAREMKKPCIIGTKIATQILHDGDLVEVDANEGVVRILEKKIQLVFL